VGDHLTAGQPMLWLEAMKMEHTVTAPSAGVLTTLDVTVGQSVDMGVVLAVVDETAAGTAEQTTGPKDGERT
jgi:propionyl-CoA carboxylase alpha chain